MMDTSPHLGRYIPHGSDEFIHIVSSMVSRRPPSAFAAMSCRTLPPTCFQTLAFGESPLSPRSFSLTCCRLVSLVHTSGVFAESSPLLPPLLLLLLSWTAAFSPPTPGLPRPAMLSSLLPERRLFLALSLPPGCLPITTGSLPTAPVKDSYLVLFARQG